MNLVDSSGWLEFFCNGPNAGFFSRAIQEPKNLLVPAVCIYEVSRKALWLHGRNRGLEWATVMRAGRVVPLDDQTAAYAAELALEHRLAMADSIILATTRAFGATLWTQDADFKDVPGVQYRPWKTEPKA